MKIFVTPSDLIVNDCVGWGTQTVPNRNKIVFLPTFWDSLQDSLQLRPKSLNEPDNIEINCHGGVEPSPAKAID